jgi:hypothetical protein
MPCQVRMSGPDPASRHHLLAEKGFGGAQAALPSLAPPWGVFIHLSRRSLAPPLSAGFRRAQLESRTLLVIRISPKHADFRHNT